MPDIDEWFKKFEFSESERLSVIRSYIDKCSKHEHYQKAHDTFLKYKESELATDLITYSSMIKCFCLQNRVGEAEQLMREMKANGVEPNARTWHPILKACEEDQHKFQEILVTMHEDGCIDKRTMTYLRELEKGAETENLHPPTSPKPKSASKRKQKRSEHSASSSSKPAQHVNRNFQQGGQWHYLTRKQQVESLREQNKFWLEACYWQQMQMMWQQAQMDQMVYGGLQQPVGSMQGQSSENEPAYVYPETQLGE